MNPADRVQTNLTAAEGERQYDRSACSHSPGRALTFNGNPVCKRPNPE